MYDPLLINYILRSSGFGTHTKYHFGNVKFHENYRHFLATTHTLLLPQYFRKYEFKPLLTPLPLQVACADSFNLYSTTFFPRYLNSIFP